MMDDWDDGCEFNDVMHSGGRCAQLCGCSQAEDGRWIFGCGFDDDDDLDEGSCAQLYGRSQAECEDDDDDDRGLEGW